MNHGFHNRRTMTPAMRHIRSVSIRHTPHRKARKYENTETIEQTATVQKTESDEMIETVQETEVRLSRKEKRKLKREQMYAQQAEQPYSTLFERIFHPFRSIDKAKQSAFIDITVIASLLAQFFKWLLFAGIPAYLLEQAVRAHAFSYAQMPFSTTAGITLLIALIGWGSELLIFTVLSFGTFLHSENQGFASILDIRAHALPCVLAMMIPCYIMAFTNVTYAMVCLLVILLFSVALDLYALKTEGRKNTVLIWSAYGTGLACMIPLWMIGIQEIERQLADILMIINL